jgi:hypothetical protein
MYEVRFTISSKGELIGSQSTMINPPAGTTAFTISTSTDQAIASFPIIFSAPTSV